MLESVKVVENGECFAVVSAENGEEGAAGGYCFLVSEANLVNVEDVLISCEEHFLSCVNGALEKAKAHVSGPAFGAWLPWRPGSSMVTTVGETFGVQRFSYSVTLGRGKGRFSSIS